MNKPTTTGADVLGVSRLALEAVAGVTELVEAVHLNVLHKVASVPVLGAAIEPALRPVAGATSFVYRSIKSVTRAVGGSVDQVARRLVPLLGKDADWPGRNAVVAALNGVMGDRLAASANPLAISMQLRPVGVPSSRIAVLAHGLCMSGAQWLRDGVDHGTTLASERGYTPVYLDYNSGRHISLNGRDLAAQMQALVDLWPVPVDEIVIVAHSMGGLVARSACLHAEQAPYSWRKLLTKLVFLGTPHHGAPLERGGNWIGMLTEGSGYSAPFARLARIRSEGITDLRHGSVLDEDWQGQDRFRPDATRQHIAAPAGVQCLAIAATVGTQPGDIKDKVLNGDGLVPVESALGAAFGFEQHLVCQTTHMQLLSSPRVRDKLLEWL